MPFSGLLKRKKDEIKVRLGNTTSGSSRQNLVELPPLGLLELAKGIDPAVDIVAVHGLNGHREKSWTAKNNVNWLRDLLPEVIPKARIFSWGYGANTHSRSPVSVQYLYDHSTALVSDLGLERQLTGSTAKLCVLGIPVAADKALRIVVTSQRPMGVLLVDSARGGKRKEEGKIAHVLERQRAGHDRTCGVSKLFALSGQIKREIVALIHSDSARKGHLESQRAIKISTYGILFLGTPHQGGAGVEWGKILLYIASIFAQTNKSLLRHLEKDSEWSQQQSQQYAAISNDFVTRFAYETYPTPTPLGKSVVVPKSSAVIPGAVDAEQIAIMADHINMAKYPSAEDSEFRKVSGHLLLMANGCTSKIEMNWRDEGNVEKGLLTNDAPALSGQFKADFKVPFDLTGVPAIAKFIGRDTEIEQLREILPSVGPDRRKVLVLHGLGGIGKTQLAIEFARRHRDNFSAIFWLNGKTREALVRSIAAIAKRLSHAQKPTTAVVDLKEPEDVERKAREVLSWLSLEGNSKWLLIFDNIDKDDALGIGDEEAYCIESFFPGADQGSIIITTRLKRLGEFGKPLPVGILGQGEALELLAEIAGRAILQEDDRSSWSADAMELTTRLDGLPLAIVMAGSYISLRGTSVSKYLQLYRESWRDLQRTTRPRHHYPNGTIETTWTISYEEIQKADVVAAKLLLLLACFDNQDIWFGLLEYGKYDLHAPGWFRKIVSSETNFYGYMAMLLDYSLIEAKESSGHSESYSMHPVVQDWCNERLDRGQSDEFIVTALASIGFVVPTREEWHYDFLQQRLLPHANQILSLIDWRSFQDNPREFAIYSSLSRLGILYQGQGKLTEAEATYQRALVGAEELLDPGHNLTLDTVNNLGNLYLEQGKFKEAEAMFKRALAGYEKALGLGHSSTLNTISNLGNLYMVQGKPKQAEAMYERALKGKEKALGLDHASTLDTANNLGILYLKQGKPKEAEAVLKRVLMGIEKALGLDHTSTLETVNNLGNLYLKQGKLEEAEAMDKRALMGKEKALGLDHTSTLDTVDNLGNLYLKQGKLEEAKAMYERALKGKEKALGSDHTSTLDVVHNLGNLYLKQGKLEEAEAMDKRALMGKEKALGLDHTSTLDTVDNLGNLYLKQGKLEEAKAMYERALKGKEKALGSDHTSTLDVVHNLGSLYEDQDRAVEAETMYERALAGCEKVLGPDHSSTLLTVNCLGRLYEGQGKLAEAEALYQRHHTWVQQRLANRVPSETSP
ncbi:hypothetical protein FGG08_004269 [Glutinoglossum americanum]|uniref:Orc1-like AAA ATPase domain-containing protein n=1 Tax=Glutinoglossum americanum TaxID=1670608 RepID=A0A9P8I5P2_9PEZI|nr:hypothetical protein FGG08_004269 [Glutinoglossum americanum]